MLNTLFRSRPQIEELEPRILFSADAAALALDSPPIAAEQRILSSDGEYSSTSSELRQELVVIDSGVQDYQSLLSDILQQADGSRHIDVLVLNADQDGIEQISQALQNYDNLDALHVISHGESGQLQLGNDSLDTAGLATHANQIADWRLSFTSDADILLYGCDVAAEANGASFLAKLSQLTGTDVSASTDKTGNVLLGGDWILEKQVGLVETASLAPQQATWQGTLDITPTTSDIPANTETDHTQETTPSSRQVAISPDGRFVAVWTSDSQDGGGKGVYLRRFDVNGNPLTNEIQVNTTTAHDQQMPAIAMDADGNFVVVWDSDNQDGDKHGIFGQRFYANASKNGLEFQVNTSTSDDQTSPSIGMDAAGNFVVAWVSDKQDGDGLGVFAQRFDASAGKLGSEFRVNTTTAKDQYQPAVAMNASGAFVIVWTSENQDVSLLLIRDDGVYGRLFDKDGNTVKSEFRINSSTLEDQYAPDVAMNASGQFVVVMTDEFFGEPNIAASVFDSSGNRQGSGIQVNQRTADKQFNPVVAIDNAGDFIVAWESEKQDGDQYGIVARQFHADYTPYANEQVINNYNHSQQLAPSIALNNTQVVFLWSGESATDNHGVSFQLTSVGNTAPVITSNGGLDTAAISIPENTIAVTTVTASDADLPAQTLSYSIIGGTDKTKFAIDASGVLTFITAPNYEIKTDSNADNVYQVIVQVSDGKGGSDSQTINVTVTDVNEAPLAQNDVYAMNLGSPLNVLAANGVLANDSDPESDGLSVNPATLVGSYGTLILYADGSFDYSSPSGVGQDSFTYTISDGKGNSSVGTVTININAAINTPPVANDDAYAGDEDTVITGSVLANDTDFDGNSLTITLVSGPSNGSLSWDVNGSFSYTPNLNFNGADSFTYKANDGSALSNIATVNLTVNAVNDAPTTSPVTLTAIAEDSGPRLITQTELLSNASDLESDALSVSNVSIASGNGVLLDNGDNTWSYTPALNDNGSVSFNYTITDNGTTNAAADPKSVAGSATLEITPTNDPPVANDDAYTGDEDTAITGVVLANDTDPDADSLTIAVVTDPSNGTLNWDADGSFNYTPNLNFNGSDSFTYKANDGSLDSNIVTVNLTVNPVNDDPVGTVSISGTPTQNQTLTASNNLTDADGLGSITYTWRADGSIVGTGTTYVLTEAEVNKTITVTASYTDGHGTNESVDSSATSAVVNVNDAPVGTVSISGTPTQNQTLTASNNLTDADGLGSISYTWKADGTTIGTGTSYVLTEAEVNKTITVTASYTDGHGTNESVDSSATSAVANVNDAPVGTVSISGTPTQNQTLTASNNLTDADGMGSISYTWKADGSVVGTGTTYVLTEAEVNKTITVTASYTDGHGTNESVDSSATSAVANVNDAPVGTVSISGTPTQNQTLTASNNLTDADGLGSITYTWKADGSVVGTGTTYALTEAEVNKTLTVTASYIDGHGTNESVDSSATSVVVNVNDAPVGTVSISGTPTQNQTLTASNNLTDADGLGSITYTWKAGGTTIGTGTSYVLTEAEVNKTITVTASYTDGHGTNESVDSSATSAVSNVNDAPVGTVSISGTPTQNQTLTASNNLTDADGLGSITYTWKAGGTTIGTGTTYLLTEAEVNKTITVTASYTDGHGTNESVDSSPTAPVANVNDAPVGTVSISGTPTQNQTLTASNNLTDADGLGSITYTWRADGSVVGTGTTYVLTEAEVNKTITVTASYTDGHGTNESVDSSATSVVVNVNDAPTTGPVTLTVIAEDSGPRVISQAELLINAADVDGDSLIVTGLAISSGNGSLVNNGNGSWTYTPATHDDTSVSFSYDVSDGSLTALPRGSATLDITPVNDDPTSSPVTLSAIAEDSGPRLITQAQLLVNAADVEGSPLIASGLTISSGNGSLVNNGNGSWTYIPALHDSGAVQFSYTISDSNLSITASANLNIAPNIAPLTVDDSFSGPANKDIRGNILSNDTDAEQDVLTAVLVTPPSHGSLALNGDGSFVYTPALGFAGNDSFSYLARDTQHDSNIATVKLSVNLSANLFSSIINTSVNNVEDLPVTSFIQLSSATTEATETKDSTEQTNAKEVAALGSFNEEPYEFIGAFNQFYDTVSSYYQIMFADGSASILNTTGSANNFNSQTESALPASFNDALSGIIKNINSLDTLKLSLSDNAFRHSLDQLQKQFHQQISLDRNMLTSALTVSTGLSVGYVIWLIRGGVLLSSVLTSLPAWRLIDPLPILGNLNRPEYIDDDSDSLEGILKSGNTPAAADPETDNEQA